MPRWLRRLLLTVSAAAVLVAVVAGVSLLLLQTPAAKRLLAERLAVELASATGFGVEIGGLDGTLPFSAEATDIRLSDIDGAWLTVDRLAVAWRPSALLGGRLHVTRIVAGEVALDHVPATPDAPEDKRSGLDLAIGLPRLPLPTEIDELRVERLALAPQVLGTAAVLRATGHASLGGEARDAALALQMNRIDGAAGQVRLQLAQSGTPALLTLAANIDEPAGGLIARALSLPGLPPVSLQLAGDGPATAWQGRLAAAAGAARLDADLTVAVDDAVALELDGRVQEAGGLAPDVAVFVPPSVDVAARLDWQPGRRLDVERLRLAARDATAELSGGLDVDGGRIQGSLELAIADAARWRPLLKPASIRTARLAGSLSGTLEGPAFQLEATVDGLSAPEFAAARTEAKLRGTAILQNRHVVTAVSLAADGRSSGLTLGIDPRLAALIGDSATWSLQADLDLVGGGVEIEQAKVAAKDVTVDVAGSLGGYGRAVDATVEAGLADVAPVAALLDLPAVGSMRATARVTGDTLAPLLAIDVRGRFAALALDEPTVSVLLGSAPTFAATIAASVGSIDINALTIDGAVADVSAGGRMTADASSLALNVAATVAEIAPVAATLGVAARGGLAGRVQLTRTPERPELRFAGTADTDGLVVDAMTSALLGPAVQATAEGTFGPAGVELATARIEGAAAQLTAGGRIGDALALDYRLALPRLAALLPLAGIDLEGSATVAGDVSGPLASPAVTGALTGEALSVAGVAVASVEGTISARDLANQPRGDLALDVVAQGQQVSLATSYQVRASGDVAFDGLRLTGPRTSLSGDLVLTPAGLLEGRMRGGIGDLASMGALVGESMIGAADFDVTFTPRLRGQAIDARVETRDLSLAAADGAPLSARQLTLTAALQDAFGTPGGRAELHVTDAASGELRLAQATISAAGTAAALDVRLTATGAYERPLTLDAAGELALGGTMQRLRVDRLAGSFNAIQARLNAPAILSYEAGAIAVADLNATVGEGRLTGAGRIDAEQADLRLSLADLPLGILAAFAPQIDVGGMASAELHLIGPTAAPAAHADVRLADLRVGGTRLGETVGVAGTLTLDLRDGQASVAAKLEGPPDFALDGQATVPLSFGLQPFALALAETAPIDGTIDGRIDLGLVPQIVDLRGHSLGGRLDVDMTIGGTLVAPRLVGDARVAAGSYARADGSIVLRDVAAEATGDNDRIVLRALTARDGGEGRVTASGSATLGGVAAARYEGEITLVQFAIPGGEGGATTASGHVAGNAQLAAADADGRRRFAATADARDLAVDGRSLAIFGPDIHATFAGAFGADDIAIETARVVGADGSLTGSGRVGDTVDLDYRVDLQRLAALSALAGVELDGSAEIAGKVAGPAGSPDATAALSGRSLRVAGILLDSASGNVSARDLGGSPQGAIDLALVRQARRLTLATPFRLREDGAIALDDLRLAAPQTALTGNLTLSPLGLLDGRLRGEAGDVAWLGPFIGQAVSGAATLDLSFASARRTQGITADVEMRKLSLSVGDGAPLSVRRARLTAALSDVLGTPGGRAELRIDEAASGGLSLSRAVLTAEGAGRAMKIRLDAAGAHGRLFEITAAGDLSLAAVAQRLRLDRLDAKFGPVDARLNAPATLARDGRGVALDGLDASVGKGRVTGGGSLGRPVALQLALTDLPLDIVTAFAPELALGGTASADLRLAGTPAAPTAHGEVRLVGLRSGGIKIDEGIALDGTLTLDLQRGRGLMTARFGGPSGFALDVELAAPVAFRIQPFALDVGPAAPLAGRIAGRIDLGLVPRVVDLHGDALDGQLDLDMTIGGTRAAPRLLGDARIADGSYASAEAGTALRDIEAALTGDTERIRLQSLTATDGGAGRLWASGTAVLGGRYDGELTLERFTILNRSDAVATASGRLQLEDAAQGSRLAGAVTIESAELRIPESLPPDIVTLDVIELNVPSGRKARAAPPKTSLAPPLRLAVAVDIPGRAFLRGRGVVSEWRGNLRVAGTMAQPDITGRLQAVRGGVDLLGTEFMLESGTVTFIGGDKIDPELDVVAAAEANEVDARVRVTGFASAPRFEITSGSGLPPEEAMARLLFGQSAGSLSPAQAVQLARAAAALISGGGPDVLDRLRRGIGLDVLSLSTGPDARDTRIRAGRHINDRVFLKVEQGLTQESREVSVEVRVLPRVTVEGGVGHEGNGRVGVNWRYEY